MSGDDVIILTVLLTVFVVGSGSLYIVLRILFSAWARQNKYFTFRQENHFTFIMKGGILYKILYKLTDHYVDQKTGEVKAQFGAGNEQASLFEWLFGVKFVGISPFEVLIYQFTYVRLER